MEKYIYAPIYCRTSGSRPGGTTKDRRRYESKINPHLIIFDLCTPPCTASSTFFLFNTTPSPAAGMITCGGMVASVKILSMSSSDAPRFADAAVTSPAKDELEQKHKRFSDTFEHLSYSHSDANLEPVETLPGIQENTNALALASSDKSADLEAGDLALGVEDKKQKAEDEDEVDSKSSAKGLR